MNETVVAFSKQIRQILWIVRDSNPQHLKHGTDNFHQLNFNIVTQPSPQVIRHCKLGSGLLTFILIISLLSTISLTKANAAAGTITAGNCSIAVGQTTTAAITDSGQYCYVAFRSGANSFTAPSGVTSVDLLVIAGGGGGGGGAFGGGGGSGEIATLSNFTVSSSSPTNVSVGAGGGGGSASLTGSENTANAGESSWVGSSTTFTAAGGGNGASFAAANRSGGDGGSGGGATESDTPAAGALSVKSTFGTGAIRYGNNGGSNPGGSNQAGGGGGGAGATGTNSTSNIPGAGGIGTNAFSTWISAISSAMSSVSGWSTATTSGYIGGGGGGGTNAARAGASGGSGGGGAGGPGQGASRNGIAGTANTGGGGGGATFEGVGLLGAGGAGGSGLVVIRYLVPTTLNAAAENAEAARVAAANAEAARKAKDQRELTEILALIPKIGELTLGLGETTKSLYSTKCVKDKTTKFVKKGSKCPKGYVKRK